MHQVRRQLDACSGPGMKAWSPSNRRASYFLNRERLDSVLNAMMADPPKPLLPLQLDEYGALADGFHRYYASLILGFSEAAVLCQRRVEVPRGRTGRWMSSRQREALRAQKAQRAAERDGRRRTLQRYGG